MLHCQWSSFLHYHSYTELWEHSGCFFFSAHFYSFLIPTLWFTLFPSSTRCCYPGLAKLFISKDALHVKNDYWWPNMSQMEHVQEVIDLVPETNCRQWAVLLWNVHEYLLWNSTKPDFSSPVFTFQNSEANTGPLQRRMMLWRKWSLFFTWTRKNQLFKMKWYFPRDDNWSRHVIKLSSHPHLSCVACSWLRLRVRVIKKYSIKTSSATMCVLIRHFFVWRLGECYLHSFQLPLSRWEW